MKVLFAVSNENISESIIRKYQKEYKEIISSKNVYYFNAIQKELQKDNTYDRIVISEDLEPFTNNNYDAIDKFIFDKLDAISDEATNNSRNDTPIILICSDRREKSEDMLVKLFSIGVYDAVIGNDRSVSQICNLIKKPRTKKEAKLYYNIDIEDVKYTPEDENEVSEVEIQNILNHYKKLGKNEEKYAESFESIASQYSEEQLKLIANILPLNVKAVLETTSPKYQRIMTSSVSNYIKDQKKDSGISMNFIPDKTRPIGGNVIVPGVVDKNNVRRVSVDDMEKQQSSTVEPVAVSSLADMEMDDDYNDNYDDDYNDNSNDNYNDYNNNYNENYDNNNYMNNNYNNDNYQNDINDVVEESAPKRGRGRPRKNPLPDPNAPQAPKRGRGRPRKNPITEENDIDLEPINPFDILNDEDSQDDVLPGFDNMSSQNVDNYEEDRPKYNPFDTAENNNYNDNYSGNYNENYNNNAYEPNQANTNQMVNTQNFNPNSDIQTLLIGNKKLVAFVGSTKNGTSFLVNNLAEYISSTGVRTAILDATRNKNSYFIYTQNEEQLRRVAAGSISGLQNGIAQGIKVNKYLTVFTAVPDDEMGMDNYEAILQTLIQNYDLILMDCDFTTNLGYFSSAQEIYLVQSLDVLTIQPLTAFLRDLKAQEILKPEKIRIVINKDMKVRGLTDKAIIGGMSFYNEPAMSFMTELFNRDNVQYCSIPFEEQTYSKYLEGLVNCRISLKGYSKTFMTALKELNNMIYPLYGSKTNKNFITPQADVFDSGVFSSGMNDTLNQMKKNY